MSVNKNSRILTIFDASIDNIIKLCYTNIGNQPFFSTDLHNQRSFALKNFRHSLHHFDFCVHHTVCIAV